MIEQPQIVKSSLTPGIKLQFLRFLLLGLSPNSLIDPLSARDVLKVYEFIWEKALEIGIRIQGDQFSQNDIKSRLKSIEEYKMEVDCKEPLFRCITNECVDQNSSCVKTKLKEQFNRIYSIIAEYLEIEFRV